MYPATGYSSWHHPETMYGVGMSPMMGMPHSTHGEWCQIGMAVEAVQSPISCVSFDTEEELVFAGHHSGRIVSYAVPSLDKYSAFVAHDGPVLDVLSASSSVLSLSHTSLRCHKKGGLQQFEFSSDNFGNEHLLCMCGTGGDVLIGGEMASMFVFDLETQRISNEVSMSQGNSIIRTGRLVGCGGLRGQVSLRDPRSFRVEHTVDAFHGAISGLDIKETLMAVCGYAANNQYFMLDPVIKVYDIRTLRQLPTVPFPSGAFQLKFFPMFTSMLVAFSQTGEVLLGDIQTPAGMEYYQVDTFRDSLLSMDLSSSGEALCFGDGGGHLHLWAGSDKPQVNRFSKMTNWPKAPNVHRPPLLLDDSDPLSCIPFPETSNTLLSSWPKSQTVVVGRPPPRVRSNILETMRVADFVGYAPATGIAVRNQCESEDLSSVPLTYSQLALLSGVPLIVAPKANMVPGSRPLGFEQQSDDRGDSQNRNGNAKARPSRKHRRLRFNYGRLGLDEYDFSQHNRTRYAGLENSTTSSYVNSILQCFYFVPQLRTSMMNHLCSTEHCVSCELGFLFRMMELGRGRNCHIANLTRVLHHVSKEAGVFQALFGGLTSMDGDPPSVNSSRTGSSLSEESSEGSSSQAPPSLSSPHDRSMMFSPVTFFPPSQKGDDPIPTEWRQQQHPQHHSLHPQQQQHPQHPQHPSQHHSQILPQQHHAQHSQASSQSSQSSQHPYAATFKLPGRTVQADPSRLETFHSFLLEYLSKERSSYSPFIDHKQEEEEKKQITPYDDLTNVFDKLFGFSLGIMEQCSFCGKCSEKRKRLLYLVLEYPATSAPVSFASLLQKMFFKNEQHLHLWCPYCDTLRDMSRVTYLVDFPIVLCIHANVNDDPAKLNYWSRGQSSDGDGSTKEDTPSSNSASWLPHRLLVQNAADRRHVSVQEFSDRGVGSEQGGSVYQLTHCVSRVVDPLASSLSEQVIGHFVAHIMVPAVASDSPMRESYQHGTGWFMFNDVEVSTAPKTDVSRFNEPWKRPCILYYTDMKATERFPVPTSQVPITDDLFFLLSKGSIRPEQLPPPGGKLAIDSEFVYTASDETDNDSATNHTLARLSILLDQGFPEDVFVDDYIHVKEPVVDYLTQFSGINEGDLSPATSTHPLSMMKETYIKLRYLIDRGHVFVGHGLKKDFRTINVVVPQRQVIDTVEIFHLSRQRKISLRFLAAVLLGTKIQSETHCSVEDARTALLCFKKSLDLKHRGVFSEGLHQIYHLGHQLQWNQSKCDPSLTIDILIESSSKQHPPPPSSSSTTSSSPPPAPTPTPPSSLKEEEEEKSEEGDIAIGVSPRSSFLGGEKEKEEGEEMKEEEEIENGKRLEEQIADLVLEE